MVFAEFRFDQLVPFIPHAAIILAFFIGLITLLVKSIWLLRKDERLLVLRNGERQWKSTPGFYWVVGAPAIRVVLGRHIPEWRGLSEDQIKEKAIKLVLRQTEAEIKATEKQNEALSIQRIEPKPLERKSMAKRFLLTVLLAPFLLIASVVLLLLLTRYLNLPNVLPILALCFYLSALYPWYQSKFLSFELKFVRELEKIKYVVTETKKGHSVVKGAGYLPNGCQVVSGFYMVGSGKSRGYRPPLVRNSALLRSTIYIKAPKGEPLVLVGLRSKKLAQSQAVMLNEFLGNEDSKELLLTATGSAASACGLCVAGTVIAVASMVLSC